MLGTAPNEMSVATMAGIDALPAEMRSLVHEYGVTIVAAMWNDGSRDAAELAPILEERRRRAQQQWLDTDFFTSHGVIAKKPPRPVMRTREKGRKATFAEMMARYQDAEKLMMNWKEAG